MSKQYNLQFTFGDSGLSYNGVMTVDTATNIVTDLYELSDSTMKNLVNSITDPRVSVYTKWFPYRNEGEPGYNPNNTNTFTLHHFQDGNVGSIFDNAYDVSYGTTDNNNYLPFSNLGIWLDSLGSDIDEYAKNYLSISPMVWSEDVGFNKVSYIINSMGIMVYSGEENSPIEYIYLSNFSISPFNVSCFTRNTKITTADGEVSIQNIRMGTLIPTLSSGLKEVVEIGVRNIKTFPDIEDVGLQIYRYEDGLRVTGKHSVLVDELTEEEQILIPTIIGSLKQTEGKWLLPACIDPYAEQLEASGTFTVYHLVLENDDDDANYGIVAHNTWVETCSKNDFDKYVR